MVDDILEDKNGNIWFGSRGGLLLKYDPIAADGKSFSDFSGNVARK